MPNSGGNGTAALMNALVDSAILSKCTAVAYGHNAVDTIASGLDDLKTELSAHFDYVAAQKQAGNIAVLTISQWWARDGGSSVPLQMTL